MNTHLQIELSEIQSRLFEMADRSMEAVSNAVDSLKQGDSNLAAKVIDGDSIIDSLEKEIDESCVKILVTRQPAAVDLRLVLFVFKNQYRPRKNR